jgi:hypothetical protein
MSLPMISFGTFLGANSANQVAKEIEGNPISLVVGISGACANRASLITA